MENKKFCSNCGAQLSTDVNFCPKCGVKVSESAKEGKRFCPMCGMETESDAAFCPGCGTEIPDFQEKSEEDSGITDVDDIRRGISNSFVYRTTYLNDKKTGTQKRI